MPSREDYMSCAERGLTQAETAKFLSVTVQAVSLFASKNGVSYSKYTKDEADMRAEWAELNRKGQSNASIGRKYGRSAGVVSEHLKSIGLRSNLRDPLPPKEPRDWSGAKDKLRWSPQTIIENFRYDPKTGVIRKKHKGGFSVVGYKANASGYATVRMDGRNILAHRVAWVCYHGGWPDEVIDHVNECKSDNRIENLQSVTSKENIMRSVRNRLGDMHGVRFSSATGKYRVSFSYEKTGGRRYFGQFDTLEDAKEKARQVREQASLYGINV